MRAPGDGEGVVPRRMEGGIPDELVVCFEQWGDFAANDAAERWLSERGYSVGRMQRGAPRGVLYGDHDIQKWRNLSKPDRLALDGHLIGNFRDGPIVLRIWNARSTRDEKPNPEGGER